MKIHNYTQKFSPLIFFRIIQNFVLKLITQKCVLIEICNLQYINIPNMQQHKSYTKIRLKQNQCTT